MAIATGAPDDWPVAERQAPALDASRTGLPAAKTRAAPVCQVTDTQACSGGWFAQPLMAPAASRVKTGAPPTSTRATLVVTDTAPPCGQTIGKATVRIGA